MGQAKSFAMEKKTAKEKLSDRVVLKNIKLKGDSVHEAKTNGANNSITEKKGDYLKKSHLNSCITHVARSYHDTFVPAKRRTPNNQGSSYAQNDDERQYKESYEKKIECLEIEVKQLKADNERMTASSTTQSVGSQTLRKDYKKRIQSLEEEVQHLTEEKHKLVTRLSEICAVQLTYNNPNIADLSDTNRPVKLIEQMSELYDNEWTDAYEYLTQIEGLQDEETVRQLLNILHTIYTECMESRKKQTEDLSNAMLSYLGLPRESKDDFTLKEVFKRLRQRRATQFESFLGSIVKDARDQFIDQLERKDCGPLDKYIQKCSHVCWFMCIKDPQMYLDFGQNQTNGAPDAAANDCHVYFDTTQFVSYTRAGMYLEYVVWPAVYLYKNGPIIKRGVAQGRKGINVVKNGENSKNTFNTINVDADHGYHGDNFNSDILKRKDDN